MKTRILLAAAAALALTPGSGFAAGEPPVKCADGLVFDTKTKKCEKKTSLAPDQMRVNAGMELAYAGDYDAAIAVLWRVADWQTNPRALNYLGYAHRKSGKLDEAFSYYKLALSADPNYTLARAYLGEGYLAIGRLDLAEKQLTEIENRVGIGAREYQELAGHIAAYKAA